MKDSIRVGKNIRAARKERGWTQQQLSNMARISSSQLSAFENGKKLPSLDSLARLGRALNVSLDELYYGAMDEAFLHNVGSEGRAIVNSLAKLHEARVLVCANNRNTEGFSPRDATSLASRWLYVEKYAQEVMWLLLQLSDYSRRKDSFPEPQVYVEQLLGSSARDIDKQLWHDKVIRGTEPLGL